MCLSNLIKCPSSGPDPRPRLRFMGHSKTAHPTCLSPALPSKCMCMFTEATWLWIAVRDCVLIMLRRIIHESWDVFRSWRGVGALSDKAAEFPCRTCPEWERQAGAATYFFPQDSLWEERWLIVVTGVYGWCELFLLLPPPRRGIRGNTSREDERKEGFFAAVFIYKAQEGTGREHLQCSQPHFAAANTHAAEIKASLWNTGDNRTARLC